MEPIIYKLKYTSDEEMFLDMEGKELEAFVKLGDGKCDLITYNQSEIFNGEIVTPTIVIHQFL